MWRKRETWKNGPQCNLWASTLPEVYQPGEDPCLWAEATRVGLSPFTQNPLRMDQHMHLHTIPLTHRWWWDGAGALEETDGNRERVCAESCQRERHRSEVLCHSSTHNENIWATRGGDGGLLLWAAVTLRILCRIMHSAVLCTAAHVCAAFCWDFNERVGAWLCLIPSNPGGGKNTCETKGWGPQEDVMWFDLSGLRRGRAGERFY